MALILDDTTGVERIGRELLAELAEQLNAQITAQSTTGDALDTALASRLGTPLEHIAVEHIASENFYFGSKPSLIKDENWNRVPNVVVVPMRLAPQGLGQLDHFDDVAVTFSVEVMVRSGPFNDNEVDRVAEDTVNRRLLRTVDAVVAVIQSNRTLGGIVEQIPNPATIDYGEIFVGHDHTIEQSWYWQGAVMTFNVPRPMRAY